MEGELKWYALMTFILCKLINRFRKGQTSFILKAFTWNIIGIYK